jgi:hypothetical protein
VNRFIRAVPGPRNSVIYTDDKDQQFQFSGGARTWRNNNPGNLVSGNVSRRNNQIGTAGGFAVFPAYNTGHDALIDCLKTTYWNSPLQKLIESYAPKTDHNNTKRYERFLRKQTGVNDNKKIKDFTADEFKKLWLAVERMEGGQKSGTITKLVNKDKIIKVMKNKKGTITAYFIKGRGWLSKGDVIALIRSGKVDAVVSTSRSGNAYVKTRPDITVVNNLDKMG